MLPTYSSKKTNVLIVLSDRSSLTEFINSFKSMSTLTVASSSFPEIIFIYFTVLLLLFVVFTT